MQSTGAAAPFFRICVIACQPTYLSFIINKKAEEVYGMNVLRKTIVFFSIITMVLAMVTIFYIGTGESRLNSDGRFDSISIAGEISIDGGKYETFRPDRKFDMENHHRYIIRGHFSEDVEKNEQIMMRIADLNIRIQVNGQEVFSFWGSDTHSLGNVWQIFTSPGITTEDDIEIELYNVYTGVHPLSINQFFDEMHVGSVDGLYKKTLSENGLSMLVGFLIFVIGICEMTIALVFFAMRQKGANRIFYSAAFAIASGTWFCIQFNIITLLIPYPDAIATADVFSPYLMSLFFVMYISTYLTGLRQIFSWINIVITIAYTLGCIVLVTVFNIDAYHTVSFGWLVAIFDLIMSIGYLGAEFYKTREKSIRAFFISLIPITFGTLLDAVGFWSRLNNETMWLRGCFLLFVLIQMFNMIWELRAARKKAERTEKELIQNRIAIMLSQIQPHFLYNALTAISRLCDIDSRKAKSAILNFSAYLRSNLDSLAEPGLITFEEELNHVKTYLDLEKMRFDDELTIIYKIEVSNFLLPSLTVQPIIENAVRHGVGKKAGGGTVTPATREMEAAYLVTIADNGVGFDIRDTGAASSGIHIGIENVRSRLKAQCDGSLLVVSESGLGTTATITIPKGEEHL